MKMLHSVFYIVKLTTTAKDSIPGQYVPPPPNPIIVDREEKWEVERVLDS